jgi:hypothetical protein
MELRHKVGSESKSNRFVGVCAFFMCLPLLLSFAAVYAECSYTRYALPRPSQVASLIGQRDLAQTGQSASKSVADVFATVVEQNIGQYSRYVIHVHDASGVDESIPVVAPPGGLLVEIRDMTGDKVWNDLVLRPALFQTSLGVLLNDGRDHFTTAVSADLPGSVDTGRHRATGTEQIQEVAASNSSRSRIAGPSHSRRCIVPGLQAENLSRVAPAFPAGSRTSDLPGRAPPTPAIAI